jgi:16S rRNA C1402 (ribose-2'-O) methylase RsmI
MEPTLLEILPNLSIGVVSIGALVYVTVQFINKLDERAKAHEEAMDKREDALRQVEKEIRGEFVLLVKNSTEVIASNAKIMERVMVHLDKH